MIKFLRKLFRLGCNHDWYYAVGDSEGVLWGGVRKDCIKRYCPKCKTREEVMYFGCFEKVSGTTYFGNPHWIDSSKL